MGLSADRDVQFDWQGSLTLARRLWSLADDLDAAARARSGDAETAAKQWLGTYGEQFVTMSNNDLTSLATVAQGLRGDATSWAAAWKSAMDQQNRVLYARKVKAVEDSRSGWYSLWGGVFGHDDLPPEPTPVATPAAPSFAATGGFYSA